MAFTDAPRGTTISHRLYAGLLVFSSPTAIHAGSENKPRQQPGEPSGTPRPSVVLPPSKNGSRPRESSSDRGAFLPGNKGVPRGCNPRPSRLAVVRNETKLRVGAFVVASCPAPPVGTR